MVGAVDDRQMAGGTARRDQSPRSASTLREGAKKVTPVVAVEKSRMRSCSGAGLPMNMRSSIFSITHRRRV